MNLEAFARFSYHYLKTPSIFIAPFFENLRDQLKKAGIRLSVPEYVSFILSVSLLCLFWSFGLSFIVFMLTSPLRALVLSSFVSLFWGVVGFLLTYFYPTLTIAGRRKQIEIALPFATTYMATIAGSGVEHVEIFRIISEFEEYGELAKEAKKIVRDCDAFGLDLKTALKKAVERCPSPKLKELLWGFRSTLTVGGDLSSFLHEKSKAFMRGFGRLLDKYSSEVSLFTEIYLTIIVVGSIFMIVLTSVMGAIAGAEFIKLVNMFAVYIFIPAAAIFFTIIARLIHPGIA